MICVYAKRLRFDSYFYGAGHGLFFLPARTYYRLENNKKESDSLFDLEINGCQQKLLIQTNDPRKPILLYLHGGPGSSIMLFSHAFSNKLKENFILVNSDQRGTALSYHAKNGFFPGIGSSNKR